MCCSCIHDLQFCHFMQILIIYSDICLYKLINSRPFQACKDFHACKWPDELTNDESSLALFFDVMNDKNNNLVEEIKSKCSQIISFSHFLPRWVIVLAELISCSWFHFNFTGTKKRKNIVSIVSINSISE